jgi:uncharacterized protein (TIGR03067 family)
VKTDAKLIPDAIAEEIKKFQGTWKQIACEKDGVADLVDEFGWEPKSTFTDETFVVTLADGSIAIQGTFKLDPTREPKMIDWTDTFGPRIGTTRFCETSPRTDQGFATSRPLGRRWRPPRLDGGGRRYLKG